MKKEFYKSGHVTKSVDICKNDVLPEKSKLLEKIRHFEIAYFFLAKHHVCKYPLIVSPDYFFFHLKALQTRMQIDVSK